MKERRPIERNKKGHYCYGSWEYSCVRNIQENKTVQGYSVKSWVTQFDFLLDRKNQILGKLTDYQLKGVIRAASWLPMDTTLLKILVQIRTKIGSNEHDKIRTNTNRFKFETRTGLNIDWSSPWFRFEPMGGSNLNQAWFKFEPAHWFVFWHVCWFESEPKFLTVYDHWDSVVMAIWLGTNMP